MNNEEKVNSLEAEGIASTNAGSKLKTTNSSDVGAEDTNLAAATLTDSLQVVKPIEGSVDGSLSSSVRHEPRISETVSPVAAKQVMAELPQAAPADGDPLIPKVIEKSEAVDAMAQQVNADGSRSSPMGHEPGTDAAASSVDVKPVFSTQPQNFFAEQPIPIIAIAPRVLRYRTRRDLLVFGIGTAAAVAASGLLLPQATLGRMGMRENINARGKEWLLNKALRIDDDVAEALYSPNRMVPTYSKFQITPIKNNYNGATPDPGYISGWNLTLEGLASGLRISLDIRKLMDSFSVHEQVTRFVCVEGWSAIAWWAGLRFDDLLRAYPPKSQARWARVESSVNLDSSGNPDPYFASIDLATARHPQTLLATHQNGQPLTVEHGAPLRLLVPVKLGLKNVKAITRIAYSVEEPRDYWTQYGYSSYDGI